MLSHTEYSKQCLAEDRVQQLSAMAMVLAESSHVTEEQTEAQRATVLWSRPQSLQGERTPESSPQTQLTQRKPKQPKKPTYRSWSPGLIATNDPLSQILSNLPIFTLLRREGKGCSILSGKGRISNRLSGVLQGTCRKSHLSSGYQGLMVAFLYRL